VTSGPRALLWLLLGATLSSLGCGGAPQSAGGPRPPATTPDLEAEPASDLGPHNDAGETDLGLPRDAGQPDLQQPPADGGSDGPWDPDGGDPADVEPDVEPEDAAPPPDSAPADAGGPDGGDPGLICPQDHGPMALVPAGALLAGDPARPADLAEPVCVDIYEVSAALFQQCVADGACDGYAEWALCQELDPERSPNQCFDDRADYPANWLDWYRAWQVCAWAGKRLPTELEWEKAARGTDGRTFPWGEELGCEHAHWGRGRAFSQCLGHAGLPDRPALVGSYPAGVSPHGLHDAAGNVKEWVEHRLDLEHMPEEHEVGVTRGGDYHEGDFMLHAAAADRSLGVGFGSQGHGVRCAVEPLVSAR